MNCKTKKAKKQVNPANIFEQEEMIKKVEDILRTLKSRTWHDLETHGKFDKNAKIEYSGTF